MSAESPSVANVKPFRSAPVFVFDSSCDMKADSVGLKDAVTFAVTVIVLTSSLLC
jgi:hypothetical protein